MDINNLIINIFNENEFKYFSAKDMINELKGRNIHTTKKNVNSCLYKLKKKGIISSIETTPPIWHILKDNNSNNNQNFVDDNINNNNHKKKYKTILFIDLNSYYNDFKSICKDDYEVHVYTIDSNYNYSLDDNKFDINVMGGNDAHSISAKILWDISKLAYKIHEEGNEDKYKLKIYSKTKIVKKNLNILMEDYNIKTKIYN